MFFTFLKSKAVSPKILAHQISHFKTNNSDTSTTNTLNVAFYLRTFPWNVHCVKSVRIRSYSAPNTEK